MAAFGLQTQKSFREFLDGFNVMKKSLESRVGELELKYKKAENENARSKAELERLTGVKEQLRQTRHRLAISLLRRVRDEAGGIEGCGLDEAFCAWKEESQSERASDLRNEVARLSRAMEKISATLEMKIMEVNNRISYVHEELSGALESTEKRFDMRMEEADGLIRKVSATATHQLNDFSNRFDEMQADAESRTERFDQQSKALGDAVELVANCTSREITFQVDNLAARLASAGSVFQSQTCVLAGIIGWKLILIVEGGSMRRDSRKSHPLPGMIGVDIEGPPEVHNFSGYVTVGKRHCVRVDSHNFTPEGGSTETPVQLRGVCSLKEAYDQRTDSITVRLELESFRAPWTLKGVPGAEVDGTTGGVREVTPTSISPAEGQKIMSCLEVVRNKMVRKARWAIHNAREALLPGQPAVKSQAFSIAGIETLEIELAAVEGKEWSQPVLNVKLSCKGVISLKVGIKVGTAPQKILSASLEKKHFVQVLKDGDDLPILRINKEGLYPLLDGGAIDRATNCLVVSLSVLSARLANRQLAPGLTVEEEEQGDNWHCEIPSFVPPSNPGGIMTCVNLPRVRSEDMDRARQHSDIPKTSGPD
ncbi:hypothetical protein FOL47_000123 [Perkinsus chesapeaki]|uniref:Uncharacterized protein n=1 Tax=Perkinsus chesapeaki TaxID=330153 RepID=A0A7J6N1B4_PERCH|nr:hypothetical protein FOL47_000123 [Perkinsus chesapeaki]